MVLTGGVFLGSMMPYSEWVPPSCSAFPFLLRVRKECPHANTWCTYDAGRSQASQFET